MRTIRILYPTTISPELVKVRFFESLSQSWLRLITSLENGPTAEYFVYSFMRVMFDWKEAEYREFLRLWSGSTLVLELEDEEVEDILTRIQSGSIDPASAVD